MSIISIVAAGLALGGLAVVLVAAVQELRQN